MLPRGAVGGSVAGALALALTVAAHAAPVIRVSLDAREAPRHILRSRIVIPTTPGEMTLAFPKWNPGDHAPSGPINDVVDLRLMASGQRLAWRRDPVDAYTIRCRVPSGARELEVSFALLSEEGGIYLSEESTTEKMACIEWRGSLIAPAGVPSDSLVYEATLELPAGWKHATSLPLASGSGTTLRFQPVTLTRLVDSPVLAGIHMRTVALTPPGAPRPVWLDIACDSDEGLAIPDSSIAQMKGLVREADALFEARHYDRYHFLLSLSDHMDHFGLEHHESSDDRADERMWIDSDMRLMEAQLLPHEYVHSWNGKYRRPAGLATSDYSRPMTGELLWVYEGLTEYLGYVLGARSGAESAEDTRADLAFIAAFLDAEPGRAWRPLLDTAAAAHVLVESPRQWRAWRRSLDYYSEGVLIWLDADVTIRRLTNGRRSLDDFCKAFYGPPSGPPHVVPYTLDDVVRTMNEVAPYDWRTFFTDRVDVVTTHAPLSGITQSGWRIAFSDSATAWHSAYQRAYGRIDLYWTIGVRFDEKTGAVQDVMPGTAADRAGLSPGMTLVAVNGRKWTKDALLEGITASHKRHQPLELLMDHGDFMRTFRVDVSRGLRYPRLERGTGRDVLDEILAPQGARH